MIKTTLTTLTTLTLLTTGALAQNVDCHQMAVPTVQGLTSHVCLAPTQPAQPTQATQSDDERTMEFMNRYRDWERAGRPKIDNRAVRHAWIVTGKQT